MHNTVSYSCLLGITLKALDEGTRCCYLNKKTATLLFTILKECFYCLDCSLFSLPGSRECVKHA